MLRTNIARPVAEYLFYWRFETAKLAEGIYDHGASEQLGKVRPGDVVWVITYNNGTLFLLGRMEVGQVVNHAEAGEVLGTTNLWEASYHIIARPGTEEPFSIIDITEEASILRFESRIDRLPDNFDVQSFRSMRRLTSGSAALIAEIWSKESTRGVIISSLPEEVDDETKYVEGAVETISVNVYERDAPAREDCIAHYGLICAVCGFDFEKIYGRIGKGFIHVHHLKPLSEIGQAYEVEPIADLRPVCPNCHAMLHRRKPDPYSIEELREMMVRSTPS